MALSSNCDSADNDDTADQLLGIYSINSYLSAPGDKDKKGHSPVATFTLGVGWDQFGHHHLAPLPFSQGEALAASERFEGPCEVILNWLRLTSAETTVLFRRSSPHTFSVSIIPSPGFCNCFLSLQISRVGRSYPLLHYPLLVC